jgi:hypothetical protein
VSSSNTEITTPSIFLYRQTKDDRVGSEDAVDEDKNEDDLDMIEKSTRKG